MLLEVNELKHLIVDRPVSADIDLWLSVANRISTVLVLDSSVDIAWWRRLMPKAAVIFGQRSGYINTTAASIKHALDSLRAQPFEVAYVTRDPTAIEEAAQTRIGTILLANGVGAAIPDIVRFSNEDPAKFFEALTRKVVFGHMNELAVTRFSDTSGIDAYTGTLFTQKLLRDREALDRQLRREIEVVVAGRYFPNGDARRYKHQLSKRMTYFKQGDRRGRPIVETLGKILKLVYKHQAYAVITRVPPKPSSRHDHLGDALIEAARMQRKREPRLLDSVDLGAIVGVRDYPQQKDAGGFNSRVTNVRGAFEAEAKRVEARNVLLVDDVLTSGATTIEAARTLYDAGATEVLICPIAIDQKILNYSPLDEIRCKGPECDGVMQIRFKKTGDAAFWGCDRWHDEGCQEKIYFEPGWRASNELNTVDAIALYEDEGF